MGGVACGGLRVKREAGILIAEKVLSRLGPGVKQYEVCGSIRREKPEVGDVDLVILAPTPEAFDEPIRALFGSRKNGNPKKTGLIDGVQVDITVATPESWGATLMHCTGSKEWNIIQRGKAQSLGLMLNQYGLFRGEERIAGRSEDEVYMALGMEFRQPKDREGA